jgi:hypothetical protein
MLWRLKLALRVGGVGVAAALLAALVSRIGAREIVAQLSHAGPGLLWILALHGAAMVIMALPWRVLLPREARPSLGGTIASRFFASGASAVVPVVGVAGELVRLLWLRPGERAAGTAAVVVDRLVFGASAIALLGAGLIGLSHVPGLPASYTQAAIGGMVVLGVVVVAGVVLARRGHVGTRVQRVIARVRKQAVDPEMGAAIDERLDALLRPSNRRVWIALALHVVARAAVSAEILVGFWLLGVPLGWDEALVFAALPIILSFAGALVPSQLGVHEGAQALVAASFGISTTAAVAVVLLLRLRQLAGAAYVGALLVVRRLGSRQILRSTPA